MKRPMIRIGMTEANLVELAYLAADLLRSLNDAYQSCRKELEECHKQASAKEQVSSCWHAAEAAACCGGSPSD